MTSWRTTPTNLRLLLLGAIGGAGWACGGVAAPCSSDAPGCVPGSGGSGNDSGGATGSGGARSSGGATGTGASDGSGGSVVTGQAGCTNPEPYLGVEGTGIFRCSEGYLWRHAAEVCPSLLPREREVPWPTLGEGGVGNYTTSADECSADADCQEHATCRLVQTNAPGGGECLEPPPPEDELPDYARLCFAGCREDSDCNLDEVCICGPEIGQCTTISPVAGCHQDSDCEAGHLCLSNARSDNFSGKSFACQLPGDQCDSDAECPSGTEFCSISETGRTCAPAAVCGRPFLIADSARIAAPVASAAWAAEPTDLGLSDVTVPSDSQLCERLAAHWTNIGLLEHASVAAFARFTLQLLSIGAPAELVMLSQQAALDEIRHAKLAFALASRYSGRDIGPGALPMMGALDACTLEDILRTTIQEGCIGETRAALEASRAAESCEDAVVRAVLETIASDEARHAELAWRAVRYLVAAHPELTRVLAEEFMAVEHQEPIPLPPLARAATESSPAARHGLLEPTALHECHRVAQREVIGPCARTMIASAAAIGA